MHVIGTAGMQCGGVKGIKTKGVGGQQTTGLPSVFEVKETFQIYQQTILYIRCLPSHKNFKVNSVDIWEQWGVTGINREQEGLRVIKTIGSSLSTQQTIPYQI